MKRLASLAFTAVACLAGAAAAQDGSMSFFVTSANPVRARISAASKEPTPIAQASPRRPGSAARHGAPISRRAPRTPATGSEPGRGSMPRASRSPRASTRCTETRTPSIRRRPSTSPGAVVNGRGDEPNRHDILTGSLPDGTAAEQTCEDWMAGGDGSAMVGHHDRMGLDDDPSVVVMELVAPFPGLQPRSSAEHGGRRAALLLRRELVPARRAPVSPCSSSVPCAVVAPGVATVSGSRRQPRSAPAPPPDVPVPAIAPRTSGRPARIQAAARA